MNMDVRTGMMKIAFITDGSLKMGMGHVYQSITLAKNLADESNGKAKIYFLTQSGKVVVDKIKSAGFDIVKLSCDNEILKLLSRKKPNIVIIDKIDVAEEFARNLKNSMKVRLIIFTNLTNANYHADMDVTADIGSQFRNIRFFDKTTKTLCFYGPKYWVLRDEFYEFKKRGKMPAMKVRSILLIFGGSDHSNLTTTALNELLNSGEDFKINVILGAHFGHLESLNKVLIRHKKRRKNVRVYKDAQNVAELMCAADLVITSPGLSTFEALCIGTPVIVMPQDSLQKQTYQGFMCVLDKNEAHRLHDMIVTRDFTCPRQESISRMQIGEGKAELIREILGSEK